MTQIPKPIQINVITDFSEFLALEKDWNALISTMPEYTPSMTFYWQKSWLEINKDKILKLHIFIFKDQKGNLIGIIPLVYLKIDFLFQKLNMYTFSGARDQIEFFVICKYEHQIFVLLNFLKHFQMKHRDWDILALRRISYNLGNDIAIERILRKNHWLFSVESHLRIPYIILEKDYPSFFQSRRKHFRHEIRRKTKKLRQLGEIRYTMIEAPIPKSQLDRFVDLEHRSWKGANASSLKHRKNLLLLFNELSKKEFPTLRMIQFNMCSGDKLISSSLCFKTAHGLHVFKIAYDESFRNYSPGILLRLYEIEQAFKMGLKIYDFSGKEQRWMHDFTNRAHHVMDYILYRKTFTSLMRYLGYIHLRPILKRSRHIEIFFKHLVDE